MDPLPIDPNLTELGLGLLGVVLVWGIVQLVRAAGNGALTFRWGRPAKRPPDEDA